MKKRKITGEICAVAALLILVVCFDYIYFDLSHLNLRIPYLYTGDGLGSAVYAKNVIDYGWLSDTDRLSAPFTFSATSFTPLLFINSALGFYRLLSIFTSDPVVIFNLRMIFVPIINALFAYYAFRKMKITRILSVSGALCFGACYFVQNRFGHIDLANCEAIPLAVLLCYWCVHEEIPVRMKTMLRKGRTWLVLLFSWIIANDGVGYYPFFACFFLACIAVYRLCGTRNLKSVLPCVFCILCIVLCFLLNFLPYVLSDTSNGLTEDRMVLESEMYGLRVASMYLSPKGFGLAPLEKVYSDYINQSILLNENTTSYLGIMGILGSILLWIYVVRGKSKDIPGRTSAADNLHWLGCLQALGIVFATCAGLAMVFSLLVTAKMRAYTRISIFLQFFAIAGYLFWCEGLKKNTAGSRILSVFLCVCITCLTFLDYHIVKPGFSSIANEKEYISDKAMISRIEEEMESGAMIYQLPYMPYPESAPIREMNHAHAMIPYMLSHQLKWSHGSTDLGAARWNQAIAAMPYEDIADILSFTGFSGILVDNRAYTEEEMDILIKTLTEATGQEAQISDNGILYFFTLVPLRNRHELAMDRERINTFRDFSLNLALPEYGDCFQLDDGHQIMINSGFYTEEKGKEGIWRWCKPDASFSIFGDQDGKALLHFKIEKITDRAQLTVSCGQKKQTIDFANVENDLYVELDVEKGENVVQLQYSGDVLQLKTDPRNMAYRVFYDEPSKIMNFNEYRSALD